MTIDLVSKNSNILYNEQIWQKVKEKFTGNEIDERPYSYFSEDYRILSKTKITNICETKLGKQHKHKEKVTSNQIIQHAKTIANSPSESTIRKQLQSLVKNKILKHNIF